MKKFLLFALLGLGLSAQAQLSVKDIVFEQELIDFGTINERDGKLNVRFPFVNNGSFDLVIQNIEVACGCTQPRAYVKRIAPGDSGVIEAEFNPKGILGNITKWIHVKANFKDGPYKELKFKAEILGANGRPETKSNQYYRGQFGYLLPMQSKLSFGQLNRGENLIDSIEFKNDGYRDHTVLSVEGLPPYLQVVNLPLKVEQNGSRYLHFVLNTELMDTVGPIKGSFHLNTDDQFFAKKELSYGLELVQDFSGLSRKARKRAPQLVLDQKTIDMGEMKSGAVSIRKLEISNEGRSDLKILRMDTDCSCAVLNKLPKSLKPGESAAVEVRFDSLFKQGLQRKGITLYTNDPENSKTIITVAAMVK